MIFISFKTTCTTGEQSGHTGTPVSYHNGIFLIFALVFFHGGMSISLLFYGCNSSVSLRQLQYDVQYMYMYKHQTPKCCDKGTSPEKPVVYLKFTLMRAHRRGSEPQ